MGLHIYFFLLNAVQHIYKLSLHSKTKQKTNKVKHLQKQIDKKKKKKIMC